MDSIIRTFTPETDNILLCNAMADRMSKKLPYTRFTPELKAKWKHLRESHLERRAFRSSSAGPKRQRDNRQQSTPAHVHSTSGESSLSSIYKTCETNQYLPLAILVKDLITSISPNCIPPLVRAIWQLTFPVQSPWLDCILESTAQRRGHVRDKLSVQVGGRHWTGRSGENLPQPAEGTGRLRCETLVRMRLIEGPPLQHYDREQRGTRWRTEIGQKAHFAPRLFKGLPPTAIAAKVCPFWFCQHSCASMDMSIPEDRRPACNLCHPQYIDELGGWLDKEFANNPITTQDIIQVMPNNNRCHHFACNGWCMHDEFDKNTGQKIGWCKKSPASLEEAFDVFLRTHPHGAGLLYQTQAGLFYRPDNLDLMPLIQQDMQNSFWFF